MDVKEGERGSNLNVRWTVSGEQGNMSTAPKSDFNDKTDNGINIVLFYEEIIKIAFQIDLNHQNSITFCFLCVQL